MKFKEAIGMLIEGHRFSEGEAYTLMKNIGEGAFSEGQNAAIIIGLSSRDVALQEIIGFRNALLELSVQIDFNSYETIDLCGTGGDGKNTFNISTLASIIVAAAGYKVAKHGNYGVTSVSGSSNVLERLGYRFDIDNSKLQKELDKQNICFLHAPLFHPALKNVANVRKQLGIKTIFNTMGPLVNPAKTKKQLVGVFNLKLARLYHYLLQKEGKEYMVVHSADGYDEISLTDNLVYFSSSGEGSLDPEELGFAKIQSRDLNGGNSLEDAVDIFKSILNCGGTDSQNAAVLANAAAGIHCFEKEKTIAECKLTAEEALFSGRAKKIFYELIDRQ